jgi:hypothetical protein
VGLRFGADGPAPVLVLAAPPPSALGVGFAAPVPGVGPVAVRLEARSWVAALGLASVLRPGGFVWGRDDWGTTPWGERADAAYLADPTPGGAWPALAFGADGAGAPPDVIPPEAPAGVVWSEVKWGERVWGDPGEAPLPEGLEGFHPVFVQIPVGLTGYSIPV